MDRISVPKGSSISHGGSARGPQYFPTVDGKMPPILCGQCHRWGSSRGSHVVAANGDVNPSWLHDPAHGGCGWHAWLHLEDFGKPIIDTWKPTIPKRL